MGYRSQCPLYSIAVIQPDRNHRKRTAANGHKRTLERGSNGRQVQRIVRWHFGSPEFRTLPG
jgi:hypothetical protein